MVFYLPAKEHFDVFYLRPLLFAMFVGTLSSCVNLSAATSGSTHAPNINDTKPKTPKNENVSQDESPPKIALRGDKIGSRRTNETINPATFSASSRRVSSVTFSRDGLTLATGSDDTTIRLWNIGSGARDNVLAGHTDGIMDVAFSPDGKILASGGWDRNVILWNVRSGQKIKTLQGHREGITAVRFTPNGESVISSSMDGSIRVWNARSGKRLATLGGYGLPVNSISISADGKFLLSGGADKIVRLWDLDLLSEIKQYPSDDGIIKAVLFGHSIKTFYTAGTGIHITKWNRETGEVIKEFGVDLPTVNSISLSSDGRRLVSADTVSTRIWDTRSGTELTKFNKHNGIVSSVKFSPVENLVASAGSDKLIKVWRPINLPDTSDSASVQIDTTEPTVWITGQVSDDSKIAQVTIEGRPISVGENSTFRVKRSVPIGETTLIIRAFDEWGNSSNATLYVNRVIPANTLPPLKPQNNMGRPNPKAVAIIIGIEKYDSLPGAKYAENDANVFYDYALNALGIPQDRIKLLIGKEASRGKIIKSLTNWLQSKRIDSRSDVYFYYAGHGLADPNGSEAVILPVNGDITILADSAIPRRRIFEELAKLESRSTTMFMDTCYSGVSRGGDSLVDGRPIIVTHGGGDIPPAGITLISAAGNNEISKTLEEPHHGIFSYFLMRALQGEADADRNGTITTEEIFKFVRPHVKEQSANLGGKQNPQYSGENFTITRASLSSGS
jgi:WD40 repeat protein